MPKYNYKCIDCGELHEQSHSFNDNAVPSPCCDAAVKKVYSAVGVTFNGSGFYRTDNRPKE